MDWSPQQEKALDKAGSWLKDSNQQVFYMFGYAGTGKSTLAMHLAEHANNPLFAAFTGKAASVMDKKGCEDARTLHSLIYLPAEKSKEKLKKLKADLIVLKGEVKDRILGAYKDDPEKLAHFEQNPDELEKQIDEVKEVATLIRKVEKEADNADRPMFSLNGDSDLTMSDLLVIDECSMVNGDMAQDILSFGKKILVLGDPAQLPPVAGAGYFTNNENPDVLLTEIHRQAADSPIVEMATKVRNGERLEMRDYGGDCVVKPIGTKVPDILQWDQVICGKNVTRKAINAKMRRLLGFEDSYPVVGDRVICLKNEQSRGLLNGVMFNVVEVDGVDEKQRVHMKVRQEDGDKDIDVYAIEHYFLNQEKVLQQNWELKKEAHEFDYGYGITCHKAQGSQWDSCVIFNEAHVFRDERHRWLYTAITRAAEKVLILQ